MRLILAYCFLILSILSLRLDAQRELILKRRLVVKSPDPSFSMNRCDYALLVPASRPGRQEVTDYAYTSVQPNKVFKTDGNEYFLSWKQVSMAELNKGFMEVSMKVKLKIYDLKTAKKNPAPDKTDLDTLLYLKDEENFRTKARSIKAVAEKLDAPTREELTKKIFDYVTDTLDYHIYFFQDRGAKQALKDGKGDCTEYSELMVTLCRAKKIPARIVMGLIPHPNGHIGYHNWVEVFFPLYGWVNFDPTWADGPNRSTSFSSMKNTYVQLSNKRFINTIKCPCYGELPFSLELKDTSIELSNGVSEKIKRMRSYYSSHHLLEADALLDTLLRYEPDDYSFLMLKGVLKARLGEFDKGLQLLDSAMKNSGSNFEKNNCLYAYSNLYALKSDGEKAVNYLREAIDLGFDSYEHVSKDTDYKNIRDYPPFIEVLNELKEKSLKKK